MKSTIWCAAIALIAAPAFAQSSQSAATNAYGMLLDSETESLNTWLAVPGLDTSIKSPNWKELVMDVSLQCGTYTRVKTKGKDGSVDTTSAGAKVLVRVMIQPEGGPPLVAGPKQVVFCSQQLTLTTKLGGIIDNLADCTGPDPTAACTLTDEEIEVGLRTLGAHAYNYTFEDLPASDNYAVWVEAMLDTCAGSAADGFGNCLDGSDPDAAAQAFLSGGSIVVEEVRFVK